MTVRTPTPLAAALGLAAEAVDGLRKVPGLLAAARERYDELARHGREVLEGHHAAAPAAEPGLAEPGLAGPGLAGPLDVDMAAAAPVPVEEVPVEEVPLGKVPVDDVPPLGRTEPVDIPDEVLEEVAQLTPGGELDHADLPLADFDHQTVPQLRGRLRTLGLPELVQLRDYEQAHAARLPVLTLLDNRIAKLTEVGGQ